MKSKISKPEQLLMESIKLFYPSAKKFRDGTFEIDIFVPELNKGVEFDGTYWHSPEGLKRSRPTWTNEQIHNYHSTKDSHFIEKGIKLIHVQEKDWHLDRWNTIYKVIEFLGE